MERALGTKLFLKADRCNSPKCVMIRRPQRPGMHGAKRHNVSEFGRQLQEKQKIRLVYGLTNRQIQNLFKVNEDKTKIMTILETRLDRVVYLLGLAGSPRVARQLVSHGHIQVNGRKVTIPSFRVRIHDVIQVRPESRKAKIFEEISLKMKQYTPPVWLKISKEELKGECVAMPNFEETVFPFNVSLVGQFYSK
ncbi:MAG: 30S ribosomal protein S4 [Candidatus Jorgensenbacteria bacterium GW2011_GWB1_49_9]|nr:MAG: 30S ribosomal protein S4 [Candidatus Jorgensenbacteria bacterium GW2011_GWB1_49_9]